MNKKGSIALILSVIPGLGHVYAGHAIRSIVYLFLFGGSLGTAILVAISGLADQLGGLIFIGVIVALFVWVINMVDMIIVISGDKFKEKSAGHQSSMTQAQAEYSFTSTHTQPSYSASNYSEQKDEKNVIIMMSIIPGLGHLQLGLVQRGMSILSTFVGLFILTVTLMNIPGLSLAWLLLFILPVLFIFSIMDVVRQFTAKEQGNLPSQHSIFVDLDRFFTAHQKSKSLAVLLAIIPGAGHIYIGKQRNGLQLITIFLLQVFLLYQFNFKFIAFVLPLLILFSVLDILQFATYGSDEEKEERSLLVETTAAKRWIGVGIIGIGVVVFLDGTLSFLLKVKPEWVMRFANYKYYMSDVIAVGLGAFIFIAIGFRLLFIRNERK
ncbi:hypothetical protein ACFSTH_18400 [Paenibacillus yanchengensis]|uniref:Multi-tm2 domain protein n=1 Tax=Paenibacillus yanchengensis TaxID=2035833 RepID=A0ABW4YPL6_9BACL